MQCWTRSGQLSSAVVLSVLVQGEVGQHVSITVNCTYFIAESAYLCCAVGAACRGFGGSGGLPRHWVSPKRHIQDWHAVVSHVQVRPRHAGVYLHTSIARQHRLAGVTRAGEAASCRRINLHSTLHAVHGSWCHMVRPAVGVCYHIRAQAVQDLSVSATACSVVRGCCFVVHDPGVNGAAYVQVHVVVNVVRSTAATHTCVQQPCVCSQMCLLLLLFCAGDQPRRAG
jgi:hypothetical protein